MYYAGVYIMQNTMVVGVVGGMATWEKNKGEIKKETSKLHKTE